MTQKEAFIHYLQNFDIKALDAILPDNLILFGVSKKTFLKRLQMIYDQYSPYVELNSLIRKSKSQPNLYKYYSGIFEYSLKFYIYCDKNDNIIKLKNYKSPKNMNYFDDYVEIGVYFGDDEKVGFNQDAKYLQNVELAKFACEEISLAQKKVLSSEEIIIWLKKYEDLFDYCIANYRYYHLVEFRNVYVGKEYYKNTLCYAEEARQALFEYYNKSFDSIDDWFSKYYRLAHCQIGSFYQMFIDIDYDINFVKSFDDVYYRGEDFVLLYDFSYLYFKSVEYL